MNPVTNQKPVEDIQKPSSPPAKLRRQEFVIINGKLRRIFKEEFPKK